MHNSQYKRFPIGISYGARVFICDNLSFIGYHVIRRKHTVNAKRDLPRLVGQLGSLSEQREVQHRRFESYRQTPLTDERTDYAILSLYREGVLNIERIAEVVGKWETPSFAYEAYVERPAWQLS